MAEKKAESGAAVTERTISAKLAELDGAVEWFYGEEFTLDEALTRYKAAAKLATEVKKDLETLKNEVEVLGDLTA